MPGASRSGRTWLPWLERFMGRVQKVELWRCHGGEDDGRGIMGGMFGAQSDREWCDLYGPPGPAWNLGSRSAVHLDEGDWDDLGFLRPHRDVLRKLMVTATIGDISGLNDLRALERLVLFPYGKPSGNLDLGCMPKLRELYVMGTVPIEVPAGHGLTWLQVERLQSKMANSLTNLTHLDELRLTAPRKVPDAYPESLRTLDLTVVRHWDQNVGVLHGLGSLRELFLNDIRGMSDLRSFAEVSSLERLYLEDCDELTSLDGPVLASEAQYLFVGRTPLRGTMPDRWTIPDEE